MPEHQPKPRAIENLLLNGSFEEGVDTPTHWEWAVTAGSATIVTVQSFAVVLDNQIYSFPTIDYKQYGDGIDPTGTGAEITGISSVSSTQPRKISVTTVETVSMRRGDATRTISGRSPCTNSTRCESCAARCTARRC